MSTLTILVIILIQWIIVSIFNFIMAAQYFKYNKLDYRELITEWDAMIMLIDFLCPIWQWGASIPLICNKGFRKWLWSKIKKGFKPKYFRILLNTKTKNDAEKNIYKKRGKPN